jgi:hypothetical protein
MKPVTNNLSRHQDAKERVFLSSIKLDRSINGRELTKKYQLKIMSVKDTY